MRAGVDLQRHQPTVDRMLDHYGKRGLELNEARLRMATLPHPAQVAHHIFDISDTLHSWDRKIVCHSSLQKFQSLQVLFSDDLWVPLVVIEGVHVLPGIPRLFKQMLSANVDTLPRCRLTRLARDSSCILGVAAWTWHVASEVCICGDYSEDLHMCVGSSAQCLERATSRRR